MVNLNDIYFRVDSEIINRGFYNMNIKKKKQLIYDELLRYTLSKLPELGIRDDLISYRDLVNLKSLFYYIDNSIVDEKQKIEIYRNFNYYIVKTVGLIQELDIKIISKEGSEYKKAGLMYNQEGKWAFLEIPTGAPSLETTAYLLDKFEKDFGNKKEISKVKKIIDKVI